MLEAPQLTIRQTPQKEGVAVVQSRVCTAEENCNGLHCYCVDVWTFVCEGQSCLGRHCRRLHTIQHDPVLLLEVLDVRVSSLVKARYCVLPNFFPAECSVEFVLCDFLHPLCLKWLVLTLYFLFYCFIGFKSPLG